MTSNPYTIIASSLIQFDVIDSIYVFNSYSNKMDVINCTVVCDLDGINDNKLLFKSMIANLEMIRSLFENTKEVILNYSIMSIDVFKEDMEDCESETYQDYCNSTIIYNRNSLKRTR